MLERAPEKFDAYSRGSPPAFLLGTSTLSPLPRMEEKVRRKQHRLAPKERVAEAAVRAGDAPARAAADRGMDAARPGRGGFGWRACQMWQRSKTSRRGSSARSARRTGTGGGAPRASATCTSSRSGITSIRAWAGAAPIQDLRSKMEEAARPLSSSIFLFPWRSTPRRFAPATDQNR
jgi:hypothetical protein